MHRIILASFLTAISLHAEDWTQFRGNNGSGISSSKSLPMEFSAHKNIAWKARIGDGVGSAIIQNGIVYASGMAGDSKVAMHAFEAATGTVKWRTEFETGTLPRITPPNSHAAATPATDGERVYIHFSTIGLLAFDCATGKEAWRYSMPRPAYLMDWGAASSPIVHNGMVIFCQDDDLAPFLVAVDAKTGKEKWKTLRKDMLAGYAVPVICKGDIVVAGSGKMKGYDPVTGKEKWTCNTLLRTIMTTPVVQDDIIYIAVQSYGDSTRTLKHALLEWLDTNQDKILARNETPKEFHERFDNSDQNKNGLIDPDEIDTAFQSPDNMAAGGNIIQAIRGGGSGDVTNTHLIWSLDHKTPSNIASPLLYKGRLYLVKSGGMSSCYDAKDGKTLWDRSRLGNFGDYFASPLAADGKVYLAGKNGFIVVLEDGPQMKVLGKHDLGEEIIATPSIADGRLFVRTRENLLCIASGGSGAAVAGAHTNMIRAEIASRPVGGSQVWNGYTGDALGQESWSDEELEKRLQQIKDLKYTTVVVPKFVKPFSAIRVDGDTAGRKAFGGAKTFENVDVASITARFREKATKMGFDVIEADPMPGTFLPQMEFTDEKSLDDLITPMCGEGVAERMWLGFQEISKANQLIKKNAPDLGKPSPDMLTRHLDSKEPLPQWVTQLKTHYLNAMSEFYRANTRAREGSRALTLYYAKKLEFAFHFASSLENLYKAHETRAESLDAAVESIYNALNSLADAARDSSDRGAIALLNENGYRPLLKAARRNR
jgi:outer membrane protein assembly factor BamB